MFFFYVFSVFSLLLIVPINADENNDNKPLFFLSKQQFEDLCQSAIVVYLVGVDTFMMPGTILDQIEAETLLFPDKGNKIKAIAQQLKEVTPARLTDKVFSEILKIANQTFYSIKSPGKRTEDYIKSFVQRFEDVASWYFVLTFSIRKAVEKAIPLNYRAKDSHQVAREVCSNIPLPTDFDVTDTQNWITAGNWLAEKFSDALNRTQIMFNTPNPLEIQYPFEAKSDKSEEKSK